MRQIRVARPEDGDALAAIYRPYVLDTAISFEDVPPTPAEMSERIAATLMTCPFLVFEDDTGVLAYAYAGPHRARPAYRWSVDVTVYAAPRAHRRGIGRALYTELLDRLTRQGFHAAFAGIALPNDKSVGLHEALGFHHLGTYREVGFKFGRWHDVGWWRRPLNDGLPTSDPLSPLS
ncbi:MAG: arsinothricin resistance N-acetyltransferase ArsN1 family B [Pseudomonadota bacterium]|uniref:arsinothricin resistance N-acetyltransferase ArsN1 family B n=1 Tax=Phenylobacterium sp. TaxID=1871053 RepID=UPI0027F2E87B|nr:N-acetyltransferase [Phenylobacterium sp.]